MQCFAAVALLSFSIILICVVTFTIRLPDELPQHYGSLPTEYCLEFLVSEARSRLVRQDDRRRLFVQKAIRVTIEAVEQIICT